MSQRPENPAETRADFGCTLSVPTRWMDNDVYGHVNNVVYYAWFDTAINRYLIDEGGLDVKGAATIGLCVESKCRYLKSVAYPEVVDVALRVGHLGRSSVRYELGVFAPAQGDALVAAGHFVHVFVDRASRAPVSIPERMRDALERLRRA